MKKTDIFEPVAWTGTSIRIIDQTRLPSALVYEELTGLEEVLEAIRRLKVRGAPVIGYTAAFGLCLGLRSFPENGRPEALLTELDRQAGLLAAARPTAVNLRWALERVRRAARTALAQGSPAAAKAAMLAEARKIPARDREVFRTIGSLGLEVLAGCTRVLTHCNTGALTTAAYGTALGIFHLGRERGKVFTVYVDETRPLLQGARITAWELQRAGIPVVLICDGAAASLMGLGKIEAVVVGADRIAANGDTANKIGTYSLAVSARAHGIPFYAAAPWSTFDPALATGREIPIEERDPAEITCPFGTPIAPEGIGVYNPAFDVTPGRLISALITEKGILRPPFEEKIREIADADLQAGGRS